MTSRTGKSRFQNPVSSREGRGTWRGRGGATKAYPDGRYVEERQRRPRPPIGLRSRNKGFEASSKGFALVEVLMSVAILSMGAVFILQALANVSYAVTVAQRQAQCHLFTLSKTAELELAFREGRSLEEQSQGTFRIQNQRFDWELQIAPVDDHPQVQSVLLSVRWSDAGHTFEREIQTLLRSYEVVG